jgi:SulP family sulfate permease
MPRYCWSTSEFRRFARLRRYELALAIATSAAVLVLAACADRTQRGSGSLPGRAGMHDVDDAALFFAKADDFRTRALAALDDRLEPAGCC